MRILIFLLALAVGSTASADLKDIFPFTCGLEYDGEEDNLDLPQTFEALDEIDAVESAPFWWRVADEDSDSKYVFGYIGGKFRAQYRRPETLVEQAERISALQTQLETAKQNNDTKRVSELSGKIKNADSSILIQELETKYLSVEDLAAGKKFKFFSAEHPDVVLVCQKQKPQGGLDFP